MDKDDLKHVVDDLSDYEGDEEALSSPGGFRKGLIGEDNVEDVQWDLETCEQNWLLR